MSSSPAPGAGGQRSPTRCRCRPSVLELFRSMSSTTSNYTPKQEKRAEPTVTHPCAARHCGKLGPRVRWLEARWGRPFVFSWSRTRAFSSFPAASGGAEKRRRRQQEQL
ncbi:hypothetical protein MJG53_001905 [Ovis ammon polii x Ovis aries]|uniref:Uncharacterized protein n=3 Tax=Ovis TaxID=9935 RepID=A0A836AFJ3_SHEEP|nr:hypothetical protein JEQ12_000446 [Ovis aries]KAI4549441.1 hypothetical protein MG293_001771 [Ovis ammon polii]KAI4580033.1 hypothetical protein MJT46_001401 [Ovis ammon polii x Ovis aries]KAI4590856.1 hypothetical protein MJG53_001905 [Ovis ammon polii x Ovis aries]